MTQIQEDVLGACNSLIKNQVDLIFKEGHSDPRADDTNC